jgi:class 3 adenylate cyclase
VKAIEWLTHHHADLIILDVMMPGWDGIRVCKYIRWHFSASELPILMLSSAGSQPDSRVRGLNAGANDFLGKPYDLNELMARVRILLKIKDEKAHSEAILSRYVTQAVRAQKQFYPELLTHRKICQSVVLFADLRGSTRLSTQTDLYSLTDMLDQFFGGMMAIVNQHGGFVVDLSGDELLAVFHTGRDLPDMSSRAITTAVAMQTSFWTLQKWWGANGFKVGLGIGIHHGEVMLGNIGGEELMRYTVTGNIVNLAHRFVELAQPGEIIISSESYDLAHAAVKNLGFVRIPNVNLKGVDKPQDIFKLCTDTMAKPAVNAS